MKKVKNILRNEKGLTLIELLAVVVILGIIAAIAIPAIASIIDNSKKDAHVANAEQLVSAARLAVASGAEFATEGETTAQELKDLDYLDAFKDPDKEEYTSTKVTFDDKGEITSVTLEHPDRGTLTATTADELEDLEGTLLAIME
ncbi:prepilin-type N-terminal cleavage/methylation domain-containing protein [Bacillus sp. AGMB 02131]|uniref:Prepilin-type N-terminal cleavage/methylation domain-containing protein n=1 Tax=Peribacillus faecalis TaxID=2772559 RepID=A0A927HAD9_9BACI|nr:prepilin-type N-terminal cleavage/methylation domain-containing protein [Peribacillus faecalis]MBD3107829.1 prepilin-type N-terminal cleavage/methylation domain-containing protein [Peribacillus faecalis]